MKRFLTAFTLLGAVLLATGNLMAATWYIDKNATAGANTGVDWQNAYKTTTNVNWKLVVPGDTIEIAAGNYRPLSFEFRVSGTSNAPVTFRVAKDSAHNGHVYLANISTGSQNWVTVDGSLNESFKPPVSVHNIFEITNNIGIHISNNFTAGVWSSGGRGQRLFWIDVTMCGNTNSVSNEDGVHFNGTMKESELGYSYIHDQIYGDGVNVVSNANPFWGDLKVHHSIVYNVGDDCMQLAGGGVDVYFCYFAKLTKGFAGGHPDVLQTWGSYYRIHHNIFGDFQADGAENVGSYASYSYAQFSTPEVGNFLLYNNLCYNELLNGSKGFTLTFDAWFSPDKHNSNVIVTNIFIANNLFRTPNMQPLGFSLTFNGDPSRGTNDMYTFVNCFMGNNIYVDCYTNQYKTKTAVVFGTAASTPTSVVSYDSFRMENNLMSGLNTKFSYVSTNFWANFTALTTGSPIKSNFDGRPLFKAYGSSQRLDFHVSPEDTLARARGKNLSSLVSMAPMLDVDLDGVKRPTAGPWDIGPYVVRTAVAPPRNLRVAP
jgi:hypothetical protein